MKILLHLLKIYTSQDNQINKTESIDEGVTINSSLFDIECPKKRSKQLYHPFKRMEDFLKTFDHNKNLNTTSESDLVKQSIKYTKFSEFEANYTISQDYSEETTKLGNLSNSNSYKNKSYFENITPKIGLEISIKLPHQEEEGRFIREIKKIVEQKQRETYEQQKKINEEIETNFASKIEELKSKKFRNLNWYTSYRHDKENVECLYSQLLKLNISSMENLDLLQILISEIEYNNKIMIYCFLRSNSYKILYFIVKNFNYLVISPLFFYNVGCYMEKTRGVVNSKDIEHSFFDPWKVSDRNRKRKRLGGFPMVYNALNIHNELNMSEVFNETNFDRHEKTQLAIVTLYNMVREKYNKGLVNKNE